jgi:hypothetical protein
MTGEQRAHGANHDTARRNMTAAHMHQLQGSSATVHALASVLAESSCLSLWALTVGTWIPFPLPCMVKVQRAVASSRTCTAYHLILASLEAPSNMLSRRARGQEWLQIYDMVPGQRSSWILHRAFLCRSYQALAPPASDGFRYSRPSSSGSCEPTVSSSIPPLIPLLVASSRTNTAGILYQTFWPEGS